MAIVQNAVGIETQVLPEKLYTQSEVDALLGQQVPTVVSQAQAKVVATQLIEKQKQLDKTTVAHLVKKSNRILVSISSHAFPIDIFPDSINVEEGRITIIKRHLFSSEVHSVDIKDISNIFINTAIFYSQLVIISKTFEANHIKIRNLWPSQAVYIRRIIEGLRTFTSQAIDTSSYSKEELIAKLEALSTTDIVM